MMLEPLAWCGLFLLVVRDVTTADRGNKKVFCYYSSFAQNRQGIGKFLPEDIDPFLCTHVIFAFVDISHDGTDLIAFNRNDAGPAGLYERTISLKEQNPALKVLLAVGGWQIGSKPFLPMISDPYAMRRWIKNVIVYLRKFNFDGFDVDWEFPATRGSPPEDKYRYTKLMKGLYEAFAEESRETGRDKLLLTMATASGTYYINTSYEPRKIIPYMDYMLLMTYNYHGQWEKRTGHHSPLWKHRHDPPGEQSELYQNWSIDFWLDMGVPKHKLVVGLATYGMTFTLKDPRQHAVHSPVKGGGRMGRYTKETGILAYYEICQNIQHEGWQTGWIEDQEVPYVYGGDQWAGFDDVTSIKIKADNIMNRDLAGAFVWSVEMDDFNGVCGDGRYPLLSTIAQVLQPYKSAAIVAPAGRKGTKTSGVQQQRNGKARDTDVSSSDWLYGHGSRGADVSASAGATVPESVMPVPAGSPTVTRKTSLGGRRRGVWRHKATRTRLPWWHRTTPSWHQAASQNARTTPSTWYITNWNALATGRPHTSDVQSFTTVSRPWTGEENAVERSWREEGWKEQELERGSARYPVRREQKSAAAASGSGATVTCHGLGTGLHLHPDDCEKFIMCMPGTWLALPPHIMACPTGTRFDDRIKVCNHQDDVPC